MESIPKGRKHYGKRSKGDIACNEHFLLHPQCFVLQTCKNQGLFGKWLSFEFKLFLISAAGNEKNRL